MTPTITTSDGMVKLELALDVRALKVTETGFLPEDIPAAFAEQVFSSFYADVEDLDTVFQDAALTEPYMDRLGGVMSQGSIGIPLTSPGPKRGSINDGMADFSTDGGDPRSLRAELSIRSPDTIAGCVYQHDSDTQTRGCVFATSDGSNALLFQAGSDKPAQVGLGLQDAIVLVDGYIFEGNRGDLWNLITDGKKHLVQVMAMDATSESFEKFVWGDLGASGFNNTGRFGDMYLMHNPGSNVIDGLTTALLVKNDIS